MFLIWLPFFESNNTSNIGRVAYQFIDTETLKEPTRGL